MQVQFSPVASLRPARAASGQAPSQSAPKSGDSVSIGDQAEPGESKIRWGNVALMAGTTLGGAAAGVYAGLNTGILPELIGTALVPGAAIGGAILGGVMGEKLSPKFLGEYPAIGGALWGGLIGGGVGVTQMFLAGSHASPVLAASMGISGAVVGLAGFIALANKGKE